MFVSTNRIEAGLVQLATVLVGAALFSRGGWRDPRSSTI
jgi:hypothetical protein